MASLPPPREFVSSLISSIQPSNTSINLASSIHPLSSTQQPDSTTNFTTSSNPLSDASNDTRKALLTLHVLFPNELIPALDLLDRGLVTRLKVQNEAQRQPPNSQSRLPVQQDEQQQAIPANDESNLQQRHIHRHLQDPKELDVLGDAERQHPGLGPLSGLREVQPQSQGQVRTRQTRGLLQSQGGLSGHADDQTQQNPGSQGQRRGEGQVRLASLQQHHLRDPTDCGGDVILPHERHQADSQGRHQVEVPRAAAYGEGSEIRRRDQIVHQNHRPSHQSHEANPSLQNQAHRSQPQQPQQPHQAPPLHPVAPLNQILHHHDGQSLDQQRAPLPHQRPNSGLLPDTHDAGVYVVRSGQLPGGARVRGRQAAGADEQRSHYEVRVQAWSCSCPAFVFAAFPAMVVERSYGVDNVQDRGQGLERATWSFGGLTLGSDMPVCKHLLACVLIEHCSLFASFVEEREVSVEELAGWAAGWGD